MTFPMESRIPWTSEEDAALIKGHGTMPMERLADKIGRSRGALRSRITKLGIRKLPYWTEDEEKRLAELYRAAGDDGVVNLAEFAKEIGRDTSNICRKAKQLGLQTNQHRRKVEERKRRNKYESAEALRAAQSESRKRWFQENDHPRGMKGKKHSDETRRRLSETSKAANLFISDEERSERIMKALRTRRKNSAGCLAPKVKRGTWDAGWREIGGKRNYYRSRWEANYGRYLQWLKERGHIADWKHEPETFWFEAIKRGVRSYLPDFRVWENDGSSALHEVKGWMDQRSRTTLKRMAKYYPDQKIVLIDGNQYRAIRLKVMRLVPGWEDSKRDSHE
jgi:hypothetical protein